MEKKWKALVVEDEMFVAADLKRMLKKHLGLYVLDTVGKGEKAVEISEAEKPDIIFMDIVLSGKMNGVETARKIKDIYSPIIIFTSGYIDKRISAEIDSLNAYKISKPYEFEEITNLLKIVIPDFA